jgi:hypothetical protein
MEALKFGAKINIYTKADKVFKSDDFSLVNYVIKNHSSIKDAHFIRDKKEFILYSPLKLKYEDNFLELISKLNNLSEDVIEVAFIGSQISFLWKEKTDITELKKISTELNHI